MTVDENSHYRGYLLRFSILRLFMRDCRITIPPLEDSESPMCDCLVAVENSDDTSLIREWRKIEHNLCHMYYGMIG